MNMNILKHQGIFGHFEQHWELCQMAREMLGNYIFGRV